DVSSEGGLLGIVASPEFATDRLVYAAVSGRDQNRIVALTIAEDFGSLAVDRVLLDGIQTADRHRGGRIVVGPDGHLWIGTGDARAPPAGVSRRRRRRGPAAARRARGSARRRPGAPGRRAWAPGWRRGRRGPPCVPGRARRAQGRGTGRGRVLHAGADSLPGQ